MTEAIPRLQFKTALEECPSGLKTGHFLLNSGSLWHVLRSSAESILQLSNSMSDDCDLTCLEMNLNLLFKSVTGNVEIHNDEDSGLLSDFFFVRMKKEWKTANLAGCTS
jgi:hypothetical protein